jgi:hypothetical protein
MTMIHEEQTKSLQSRAPRDESAERPSFLVTVVAGPDRGMAYELDGNQASRALLGTGPACTLRLGDPLVSRRHAAFDVEVEGLRLSDLGSKNGTIVDGLRAFDVLLFGGETLRVGATMLRVERLARRSPGIRTTAMAFGRAVGASSEMRRLYPLLATLAKANVPVLIEGETGTGKEMIAEALHETGPRAAAPFVVFDCSAQSAHELPAAFEQARDGTLLIDEAADLDATAQRWLLDALRGSTGRSLLGRAVPPSRRRARRASSAPQAPRRRRPSRAPLLALHGRRRSHPRRPRRTPRDVLVAGQRARAGERRRAPVRRLR